MTKHLSEKIRWMLHQ